MLLPCPALQGPALLFPALSSPALPCHARPALLCSALPCPALPCPALPCLPIPCPFSALPCPALPCSALQLIWQAVWTFVIPYILASVIKGLRDVFGRVQMSAARLGRPWSSEIRPYTSGSSCSSCQWRIQRGLLGHAPFGQKNQFLTKEKKENMACPLYLFI